jgi:hypothetical protein
MGMERFIIDLNRKLWQTFCKLDFFDNVVLKSKGI